MTDMERQRVESPCVGQCCLDRDDICLGCFRTVDEIKLWAQADDDQRLSILAKTRGRSKQKALMGKEF